MVVYGQIKAANHKYCQNDKRAFKHEVLEKIKTDVNSFWGFQNTFGVQTNKGSACFKQCGKACLLCPALQPYYTIDVCLSYILGFR